MDTSDLFKTKFSILNEISRALVETHDIRSLANIMLDLSITYSRAEAGSLMLLNDRNCLYILTARGLDQQFVSSYNVKIGDGIAGSVAKNRTPVLVGDIETDPRFKGAVRDHYKTRSFISCPIMSKKNVLGVLNINDKQDGTPFTADAFELVKSIANHAAIAFENVFLLNQLQSKATELEKVNRKLIDTYLLKNEFLMRISHELRTPLNSVKGAVYYLQQNDSIQKQERDEFQGIIAAEADKLIALVENLLSFLRLEDESQIIEKTILNLRDILTSIVETSSIKNLLLQKGLRLQVDIADDTPDIVGDKIKITQLFINLIEGLCFYLQPGDTVALTVQNQDYVSVVLALPRKLPKHAIPSHSSMRQFFHTENPENRFKLYLAWNIIEVHHWGLVTDNAENGCRLMLTIPRNTTEKLNTFINLSMDSFAEFIAARLGIDICSIMLSDDVTNELTVRGARGLDDDVIKRTRIKMGDKIAGWVALEGKPLFIEDIESDPRFAKKSIPQYTTKSLMSFPLKIGERVVGVMNLNNKRTTDAFTLQDYAVAEAVSGKISRFVERLYTDSFREDEFQNIMRDLDTILPSAATRLQDQDALSASEQKQRPTVKRPRSTRSS